MNQPMIKTTILRTTKTIRSYPADVLQVKLRQAFEVADDEDIVLDTNQLTGAIIGISIIKTTQTEEISEESL